MAFNGNSVEQVTDSRIRLRDGRALGYRETGDPDGVPVLYCHGLPGSRFQCPGEEFAPESGARLIAPERPGFGSSDPATSPYSLRSWAADVAELADALEIQRCAIVGYSLGGAYAMACAHALPRRIAALGLIGSIAPLDVPENWEGWGSASGFYALARSDTAALASAAAPLAAGPETFVAVLTDSASAVDRRLLEQRALRDRFLRDAHETLLRGIDVALQDVVLAANSWEFDVADIRVPTFGWHGLDDLSMPPAMARYLAATIPGCHMQIVAGEGHLMLFSHWREVLETVTRAAD